MCNMYNSTINISELDYVWLWNMTMENNPNGISYVCIGTKSR